jgi:hypothetical protein
VNDARRRELDAALRTRLAEQPEDLRLPWLAEQLENYVERWIGFAEAVPEPLAHQLQGDLFGMIEIAERVTGHEIGRSPLSAELAEAWRRFQGALAVLRDGRGTSAAELREPLAGLLAAPEIRERSNRR